MILSLISDPSRFHSTLRYMISPGRFSAAFVNSVIGLHFPFRNLMPSRYSAFVEAASTTLETALAYSYAATVSLGMALYMAVTISATEYYPS